MGLFSRNSSTAVLTPPTPASSANRAADGAAAQTKRRIPADSGGGAGDHAFACRSSAHRVHAAAQGPHPPAAGRAAGRAEPADAAAGHRPRGSAHADPRAVPERKGPAQQRRAGTADGRGAGRDVRPRPARNAAEGPDDQRHPDQRPTASTSSAAAGWRRRDVRFRDNAHLLQIIDRIVGAGRPPRRRDSARWSTPACPTAAASTRSSRRWRWTARRCRIRRFGAKPLKLEDLIRHGAFTPAVMDFLEAAVQARLQHPDLAAAPAPARRRCSTPCRASSRTTSASSRSRTRPNCSSSSRTSSGWKRARRTSKARARSRSATWCRTACVCGPTASSSASAAAPKRWTCSRP